MRQLSIGDAVGAGFELIRRKPSDVLLWGLVQLAIAVLIFALSGSFIVQMIVQDITNLQAGVTRPPPPDLAHLLQVQGWTSMVDLLSSAAQTVVFCAVCRAVLHPEQSRFGYLRLGAPEIFLFILMVGGYIAMGLVILVLSVIGGILVVALAAAHAVAAAVIVGVVGFVGLFVGVIYVVLRLTLVGPMMVDDGRFHFGDAWALTRRHAGGLFVVALCLFAILFVAYLVLGLVAVVTGFSYLAATAGGFGGLSGFFHQSPATIMGHLSPLLVVTAVASVPLYGSMSAVLGAPWARAYRDLAGPDLAATFA